MKKQNRVVVVVDSDDTQKAVLDILTAHKNPGILHRAVSVILWKKGEQEKELLLQQRSKHKLLWPQYWSNTVCTHPYEQESYLACAARRLQEELGINLNKDTLSILYRFKYHADYSQELSEHELDTVIIGRYSSGFQLNQLEVSDAAWVPWSELRKKLKTQPGKFTPWLHNIIQDKRIIDLFEGNI